MSGLLGLMFTEVYLIFNFLFFLFYFLFIYFFFLFFFFDFIFFFHFFIFPIFSHLPFPPSVEYGHQEAHHHQGRDPRAYCILTKGFVRDEEGKLVGVETVEVKWTRKPGVWTRAGLSWEEVPESKKIWPCDLALIAIGYQGAEVENEGRGQPTALGLKVTQGKMVTSSYSNFSYHSSGNVFVAGDCRRGQSLVVWAIKEGREAAKEVDQFLHQERQFLPLH